MAAGNGIAVAAYDAIAAPLAGLPRGGVRRGVPAASLAPAVAPPGPQGRSDPRRHAGPAPDLRRGPRRVALGPRTPGHPLSGRPPARLARRAARRRDRLPRPGRRGPADREVRRLLAGAGARRPAGLAAQDDPRRDRTTRTGRPRRARQRRCRSPPTAGRWPRRTSTATSSRPTSSRAAATPDGPARCAAPGCAGGRCWGRTRADSHTAAAASPPGTR